ncbi:MAG: hypothetical protein IJ341_02075 [Bacteroidales bacterium]|nr:hypothetical protein [Bacteroidales bacterium]
MATNVEIKKILNDIVIYTYKGKVSDKKLKDFLSFYIVLDNRVLRSKHGHYRGRTFTISIFNLYRSETQIVVTSIHELAHHIDYMIRGTTDHQKPFYDVYSKVLYTGLNMGLFTKSDVLEMREDSSSSRKVKNILSEYEPTPIPYKQDETRIVVRNCYSIKEKLKEFGFRYNSLSYTWEKVIPVAEYDKYIEQLNELSCEYDIVDASAMNFEAMGILIATGDTFEYKEELKENGFHWSAQNKRWQKRIKMTDYKDEINSLRLLKDKVIIKLAKPQNK